MNQTLNVIRHKTSVIYCLAFIYFFVALLGSNSLVLCLESDGCFAVESALDGSTCNSPLIPPSARSSCMHSTMSASANHPHCNSCVDIPLITNFTYKSVFSLKDKIPHIKIQSIANYTSLSSVVEMIAAVHPSFQPSIIDCISPLIFIRTVRLLI